MTKIIKILLSIRALNPEKEEIKLEISAIALTDKSSIENAFFLSQLMNFAELLGSFFFLKILQRKRNRKKFDEFFKNYEFKIFKNLMTSNFKN